MEAGRKIAVLFMDRLESRSRASLRRSRRRMVWALFCGADAAAARHFIRFPLSVRADGYSASVLGKCCSQSSWEPGAVDVVPLGAACFSSSLFLASEATRPNVVDIVAVVSPRVPSVAAFLLAKARDLAPIALRAGSPKVEPRSPSPPVSASSWLLDESQSFKAAAFSFVQDLPLKQH
jgi:hypothetical protein